MNEYIPYLTKVILFHGICYAAYWTLLRSSNQFTLNRVYLLSTFVLGFIAPFITLPTSALPANAVIPGLMITAGTFLEVGSNSMPASPIPPGSAFSLALDMIYLAGIFILLVRSVLSVMRIDRIRARAVEEPSTTPKVLRIEQPISFSFINTILLHKSADPAVFLHEKGHVIGKHWADLIFMETVCILFWLNPMVWLFRRSIKQQHEYLADEYVLRNSVSRQHYLLCILNSLSPQQPTGPVHKFNSHSLKQRITMMTRDHFLPHAKAFYIGLMPLVALLMWSFAGTEGHESSISAEKVFVVDAAHGGGDVGSTSASGIREKDIALEVARFVQEVGTEKGLDIRLTRTTDRQMALQERVAFSTDAKADVFLSLHLGFETDGVAEGPGMYISEENEKYGDSQRIAAVLSKELKDIRQLGTPHLHHSTAFVLKQNRAASAILEVGYLSDEQHIQFISDPKNQRRIAEKIVSAFVEF